jgi:cephalosporin hydroxylase
MHKKNIISYNTFNKVREKWKKSLYNSKIVKSLSKKLFIEADKFHFHYLQNWNGEALIQTPDDILALQEIIYKTRPEVIIEVGVAWGGSLLFYHTLSKDVAIKKIIGIDLFIPSDLKKRIRKKTKNTKKILLLEGSSLDKSLISYLIKITKKYKNFLIHLDSNHTSEHVFNELKIYSKFLNSKNYLIVGDTVLANIPNQKHRPRNWSSYNNPMTALNLFLKKNKSFKIDYSINYRQIFTNQPAGYIFKK